MTYPKNHHFNLVLLFILSFPVIVTSAEREDLYQLGLKANENRDCIDTIKYLYSFYVVNEKMLTSHPDFMESLEKKVSYCSSTLRRILSQYEELRISKNKETDNGITIIGREINPLEGKPVKNNAIKFNDTKQIRNQYKLY